MYPFKSFMRSWVVFRAVLGPTMASPTETTRKEVKLTSYQESLFLSVRDVQLLIRPSTSLAPINPISFKPFDQLSMPFDLLLLERGHRERPRTCVLELFDNEAWIIDAAP